MDALLKHSLSQQHKSAKGVLVYRKAERKRDAMALAEVIYSIYKEKKFKENDRIVMDQNNAKIDSQH